MALKKIETKIKTPKAGPQQNRHGRARRRREAAKAGRGARDWRERNSTTGTRRKAAVADPDAADDLPLRYRFDRHDPDASYFTACTFTTPKRPTGYGARVPWRRELANRNRIEERISPGRFTTLGTNMTSAPTPAVAYTRQRRKFSILKDYYASIEKLRKDAAEAALIRDLAADKIKRDLYDRLHQHFNRLADEIEQAVKSAHPA